MGGIVIGIGIENFQETGIGIGIDFSVERNWSILFSIPQIHTSYHIRLHHSLIEDTFSNTWL